MNNPQGNKPLVPYPVGCTGHRIWEMLTEKTGCFRVEYMDSFERVNILEDRVWSARAARANREAMLALLRGRTAVLLGRAVWAALALPATAPGLSLQSEYCEGTSIYEGRWFYCPHPSGLNRWYNDRENREKISTLLAELYGDYRQSVGLPLTVRSTP